MGLQHGVRLSVYRDGVAVDGDRVLLCNDTDAADTVFLVHIDTTVSVKHTNVEVGTDIVLY